MTCWRIPSRRCSIHHPVPKHRHPPDQLQQQRRRAFRDLQQAGTYATLGCIAYKSSTQQFFYFAAQGNFDECQIDKSGRYLEIKEKLPSDSCRAATKTT